MSPNLYKLAYPVVFKHDGIATILCEKPFAVRRCSPSISEFIFALQQGLQAEEFLSLCLEPAVARLAAVLQERGALSKRRGSANVLVQDSKTWAYLESAVASPVESWQAIASARIAIVGCGGIGSVIAQELTAMGFGHFVLIDKDTVCESNLNRQTVFNLQDIGKEKAAVLASRLRELRSGIFVQSFNAWIQDQKDLEKLLVNEINLLVLAADEPSIDIRKWVTAIAIEKNIPCLFSGVGLVFGGWGPLLTDDIAKSAYLDRLNCQSNAVDTTKIKIFEGSLCASNHLISSLAAWDIFHFIAGALAKVKSLNSICSINLGSMAIKAERVCE
jgi:hypothetical protein